MPTGTVSLEQPLDRLARAPSARSRPERMPWATSVESPDSLASFQQFSSRSLPQVLSVEPSVLLVLPVGWSVLPSPDSRLEAVTATEARARVKATENCILTNGVG